MGKNSWSLNDLKAKGFEIKDGKAVKTFPERTPVDILNSTLAKKAFPFETNIGDTITVHTRTGMATPGHSIFIPRNVPSSKNSRQLAIVNGKPKSFESKLCQRYRKETKTWYIQQAEHFRNMVARKGLKKPLRIQFYFVRTSKLRFDHHNAVQLIMDLMTEHGWIPDDNANEAVAVPPEGQVYHVDKKNAGVYIIV